MAVLWSRCSWPWKFQSKRFLKNLRRSERQWWTQMKRCEEMWDPASNSKFCTGNPSFPATFARSRRCRGTGATRQQCPGNFPVDSPLCPDWAAAAQSMLDATRKAEELIEPQLQLEVVNAESDVFTLNTKPSHPQACLGEAATVDTWSQGLADDLDLPEQVADGKTEGEMHRLELYNLCGDKDHHKIAATLHELGMLGQDVGDFWKAKQHSEDSHSSHAQNHRLIWSQVTSCSELFSQD